MENTSGVRWSFLWVATFVEGDLGALTVFFESHCVLLEGVCTWVTLGADVVFYTIEFKIGNLLNINYFVRSILDLYIFFVSFQNAFLDVVAKDSGNLIALLVSVDSKVK